MAMVFALNLPEMTILSIPELAVLMEAFSELLF